MFRSYILATIAALAWIAPAWALQEGDPAPALSVARWIYGEPVQDVGQSGGAVTVVAFWATWSRPSVESLMTLSDIQSAVGNKVRIIAITAEPVREVEEFIRTELDRGRLKIRIAVDDDDQTTMAYLRASGHNALPHVYVIDREGLIAWQGHPNEAKTVIDQIVAGTFKLRAAESQAEDVEIDPELIARFQAAQMNDDWEAAVGVLDEMIKRYPSAPVVEELMGQRFEILYFNLGDFTAAEDYARDIVQDPQGKSRALNNIAWTLLARGDFSTLNHRWPDIAHRAARRAFELTDGKEPAILDTYARSLYVLGYTDQAVKYQKQAIQLYRQELDNLEPGQNVDPDLLNGMSSVLRDMELTLKYYEQLDRLRQDLKP